MEKAHISMTTIQMVDLQRQYLKIKAEVDPAIQAVLETASFINGQPVYAFSEHLQAYLDVEHVIPCANGTDALQIALMALSLQPGDEIITPSFTFIATAEVIRLLGLKPVFCDVDPKTFCLDVEHARSLVTPRTRAIIPVHLFGQSADMNALMDLAAEHDLAVVEDNAQAIGSHYTFPNGRVMKTGTIGTIGCTSFFPSKNLGAYGDGGALFTRDEALAARLRMIANHGQSKRYYHDLVGCNSRLDTLQAVVLDIKLKYLDEYIAARRSAADHYDRALGGVPGLITPYRARYSNHVFHQYTILLDPAVRGELQAYLAEKGIPSMIYYPVPAHQQEMFAGIEGIPASLPVTDNISKRVLSLPMHTELDPTQLTYITDSILEFFHSSHEPLTSDS